MMKVQGVYSAALVINMGGHLVDVFHHLDRIFKHIGIDLLKKIVFITAVFPLVGYLIGPIDVPAVYLLGLYHRSLNAELIPDLL